MFDFSDQAERYQITKVPLMASLILFHCVQFILILVSLRSDCTCGDKITFNRAFSENAQMVADEYGVRDNHAKMLMADAFVAEQRATGVEEPMELKEWGKNLDEQYYRPQIEQEKQERAAAKQNQESPTRAYTRR